jgi:hypothetical protein
MLQIYEVRMDLAFRCIQIYINLKKKYDEGSTYNQIYAKFNFD